MRPVVITIPKHGTHSLQACQAVDCIGHVPIGQARGRYPDVPILGVVREPESWYRSWYAHCMAAEPGNPVRVHLRDWTGGSERYAEVRAAVERMANAPLEGWLWPVTRGEALDARHHAGGLYRWAVWQMYGAAWVQCRGRWGLPTSYPHVDGLLRLEHLAEDLARWVGPVEIGRMNVTS